MAKKKDRRIGFEKRKVKKDRGTGWVATPLQGQTIQPDLHEHWATGAQRPES